MLSPGTAPVRLGKLRATTAEWRSAYPWHFGGGIPSIGPAIGVDILAGGAPFGLDPFAWHAAGIVQNANIVIAGAPGNGKSAMVKTMLWWLVGAFGYRFVATDVKGEYTPLAHALGVPILDLRPGGSTRVNPLDDPDGRLAFVSALASLALARPITTVEFAALRAVEQLLPDDAQMSDLFALLKELPAKVLDDLSMDRTTALDETKEVRFGLGGLLSGPQAGMFNGRTNVDLAGSTSGFVVDVSGVGRDDRALSFAMLAGTRAIDQMTQKVTIPTLNINDEAWRLTGTLEGARYLQHSFKLGRQIAFANVVVVHRLSELGDQADGAAGRIAANLVSDADTQVLFRQGDEVDAAAAVKQLKLPQAAAQVLPALHPFRALIRVRDRYALVDTRLSSTLRGLTDTNSAMRGEKKPV